MQQKIKRLQAQLRDQKGKCKDTSCVSDTLDSLPRKLKNKNVELEFQDATEGTSTNTKFANQSTERKPFLQSLRNKSVVRQPNAFKTERPNFSKTRVSQKVDKTNDLSNPDTSNSIPTTKDSKVVENNKVIAPGMFRINHFKNSREVKSVPYKPVNESVKSNSITDPQPHVITKKVANSDSHGFSSTGVDITTKTRRPQSISNTKNDRVPSASKSSHIKNKEVEVEDHHRNLLLSKHKKHMSSEDYDLWSMRMEQYLTHTDYAHWEVIMNGDAPTAITSVSGGVEAAIPPKITAEKIAKRNELKAKSTMLLAILDEHLLKFHGIKDAKTLWETIKTRFGGNKESKKMQKTILKKQYENFVASRSKGLYKTYDSFQKLISQLEIHGEVISHEDANMKCMKLRLKPIKLKPNYQNMAFVSSDNTSSTNEAVNTAHSVFAASSQGQASTSTYADDAMFFFFANKFNTPQLDNEDMEQIDTGDLKEMDLKWQVAMLTIRVKIFIKKTGRNLNFNGKETVRFDKTKVECCNCHMRGHFARECRAPKSQENKNRDNTRRVVPVETPANALVITDEMGYEWSYQAEEGPIDFALMAFSSSGSSSSDTKSNKSDVFESASDSSVNKSEDDNNQATDRYKAGEGYHAVSPPYTKNFILPRPDISFTGLGDFIFKSAISKPITSVHETETSTSKTSKESMEKPKTIRPSAPIIKDWESNSDDDCEIRPSIEQNKPSHAKINFVKSDENTRKSVIKQHTYKQAENLGKSQNSRVDKRDSNGMMTQKLGNIFYSPHTGRNFVPTTVITNSGKVQVNAAKQSSPRAATSTSTARYVNTAANRPTVNGTKPSSNVFHMSYSPVRRNFNQRTTPKHGDLKEKINTAGTKAVADASQQWPGSPRETNSLILCVGDVLSEEFRVTYDEIQVSVVGLTYYWGTNTLFPTMLAIQAEEGEGSGHPFKPQPPPSSTQYIHEEQIPNIVSSTHQKTQTSWQALNEDTELPQTSVPIPNVPDKVVYKECDGSVERATTTAASLDAAHDNGNILKTQSTTMPNVPLPQGFGTSGSPRCQKTTEGSIAQTRSERVPTPPHDSPLPRVNTLRSDEGITPTKVSSQEEQPEDQLGVLSAAKVLVDVAKKKVNTYTRRRRAVSTNSEGVSTASKIFSTAEESVSTASELMPVSIADVVQEGVKEKAQKLYEEEQARFNADQVKLNAEQEEPLTSETTKDEANPSVTYVDWDDVQAQIQADEELAQKMLEEERERYKMEHFKGKSFYELKEIFDEVYKQVTSFVPMESDMKKERTKRAGLNLQEESSKRQKIEEGSKSREEPKAHEISQEDLQQMMMIVPVEEVYVEALQLKYPIIDWELWHQRLSHLNFETINDLARNDLDSGLPKFRYHKEHLCPSCEQGKSKRAPHPPKLVPTSKQRLHLLHMDLCCPMRIASLNGKRALCYAKNDREDIGKLGAKGDIGFFIGYFANSYAYRVYNRRTKKIMETMNEELLQFKRLDVWVLVPPPDNIKPLTLKWLFKHKHDEENTIIQNKTHLVMRGYRQEEGIDFEESFAPNHFFKGTIDPTLFIRRFDDGILVVHVYVDDIIFRSTHPRPDIVYATCLCARYQAKPTEKHLKEPYPYPATRSNTREQNTSLSLYHFIKEHVEKGTIKPYFVKTDYQLADLFTKALLVDRFNYLVRHLGTRSLSPQELDRLAKSQ
nr:ribonuclease H-like domain-containing protein [Tanacetum cinerariifolium]